MCKLKSNNGKICNGKKTKMQVIHIYIILQWPSWTYYMLLPSCWAERDFKMCDRTQLSEEAAKNYWHECEISRRTRFNQENTIHTADSAIRTNTTNAHKQQLQKMVLADSKIFPLASIGSVRGWKNGTCLFLDRKSPQTTEGIWVDLSTHWKSAASSFFFRPCINECSDTC